VKKAGAEEGDGADGGEKVEGGQRSMTRDRSWMCAPKPTFSCGTGAQENSNKRSKSAGFISGKHPFQ